MPQYSGGIHSVKVNGTAFPIKGAAVVMVQEVIRHSESGDDQSHAYRREPTKPSIKATIRDFGRTNYTALQNADSLTVRVRCDNGKVYNLSDCAVVGEFSFNAGDGTAEVTFQGGVMEEKNA